MLRSRLETGSPASARASHAIRSGTFDQKWLEIDSTMVDEIVNQPLPPPAEQRALFLAWMREHAGDARFAALDISDSEAMAAVVGSTDSESFQKLIRWEIGRASYRERGCQSV